MEKISAFIATITGIVLLCVITENLAPGGNYKKYVKFAGGLIIMITMLTAVFDFFGAKPEFDFSKYTAQTDSEEFNESYNSKIEAVFSQKLASEIESGVLGGLGLKCRINASVGNDFDDIYLTVNCSMNSFGAIKEYIIKNYKITNVTFAEQ